MKSIQVTVPIEMPFRVKYEMSGSVLTIVSIQPSGGFNSFEGMDPGVQSDVIEGVISSVRAIEEETLGQDPWLATEAK